MKITHLITMMVAVVLITCPVNAAWNYAYENWSAYGGLNNSLYRDETTTVTLTSQFAGDTCNATGRRFWYLEFNTGRTGMKSGVHSDINLSQSLSLSQGPWNQTNALSTGAQSQNVTLALICSNEGTVVSGIYIKGWKYFNTTPPAGIVGFTGYPLDGFAPLTVGFTATNLTNTTGVQWTFGDGNITTVNSSTVSHTYDDPGIYSVTMAYFNGTTQESITKTNYVLASLASGMIVNLDVKNAITGALIQDSTVSIRNTTTGVWRNTTAPTGLVYFSTTE